MGNPLGPHRTGALRLAVFVGAMLLQIRFFLDQGIFTPDEGIYSLYSLLLSRGALPYVDFYDNHVPGLYFILGPVFKLLGPSLPLGRVVMYIFNSLTALLLFDMVASVSSSLGLLTAGLFILGLPSFLATTVHLGPLVAALSVASMFFMTRNVEPPGKRHLVISGLLSGYLILVKQTAIFLPAFQCAYQLRRAMARDEKACWRRAFAFIASAAFPPLAFLVFLVVTRSLGEFIDQAVLQNLFVTLPYLSEIPPPLSYGNLQHVYLPVLPIIVGVSIGILVSSLRPLSGACLSLLMLTFPRFHILHLLAPMALALVLMGKGFGLLWRQNYPKPPSRRLGIAGMLIILSASGVFLYAAALNSTSSRLDVDPNIYFAVDFVSQHTGPGEPIFSLPYRAEIYFLADRSFPPGGPGIVLPGVSQDDTIKRMRDVRLIVYNPTDVVSYQRGNVNVVERMSEYAPRVHGYIEAHYLKAQTFGNFLVYIRNEEPPGPAWTSMPESAQAVMFAEHPVRPATQGKSDRFPLRWPSVLSDDPPIPLGFHSSH